MDAIFKALNDPARRALLDSLRQRDGQSLTDLTAQLDMTRFGVMKHLAVLEGANLILVRKVGRFKYHYLNAAPLQEAIDRWIAPLARGPARAIADLKTRLEGETDMTTVKPDFLHQTIIRTTPERLWQALVSGEMTRRYYFDTIVEGRAEPGGTLIWRDDAGAVVLTGRVFAADPPRRLDLSFEPAFIPGTPVSRHVFVIEDLGGGACRLTLEHYDLPEAMKGIRDGWVLVLSRLKTLLETGESLPVTMAMLPR